MQKISFRALCAVFSYKFILDGIVDKLSTFHCYHKFDSFHEAMCAVTK